MTTMHDIKNMCLNCYDTLVEMYFDSHDNGPYRGFGTRDANAYIICANDHEPVTLILDMNARPFKNVMLSTKYAMLDNPLP